MEYTPSMNSSNLNSKIIHGDDNSDNKSLSI